MEIPLLVECDTGANRAGVQSPADALALAQEIERLPGVHFEGLMTFPTVVESAGQFFSAAARLFAEARLAVGVVSGGGTPQTWRTHEVPQITEHRAGTYVFNDRNTLVAGTCTLDECAMRVMTTVVSRPTADRCILDAGSKTLSSDGLLGGGAGFGLILEYPDAVLYGLSEEHGHVDLRACARKPEIGERVSIIPNHCCATTNMHDTIVGVRREQVEVTWPVLARGKVQ
jgi:D-serine deaminase-like pyridoxal phosphate-dependent protein